MITKNKQKSDYNKSYFFENLYLLKFLNLLMKDGKKSVSERILFKIIIQLKKETDINPYTILQKAFLNLHYFIEIKNIKIGKVKYQVPIPITTKRQIFLTIQNFLKIAKKNSELSIDKKIANELIEAFNKKGDAKKERDKNLKIAITNRSVSHFRWY